LHTHLEDELRAATGLSMNDYHVLVVLSEAPERRLRMGELAGRLVFSPSRVTYQISSMVRRGLVRKQSCPDDGRGQEAVLTDEGLAALEAAAPLHLITVRDSFIDRLDTEELAVIARVFEKVRKA
jgi:DNA-binding MarR family transcriptional regulator